MKITSVSIKIYDVRIGMGSITLPSILTRECGVDPANPRLLFSVLDDFVPNPVDRLSPLFPNADDCREVDFANAGMIYCVVVKITLSTIKFLCAKIVDKRFQLQCTPPW